MLFLVIVRATPGFPTMPPQQQLAALKAGMEMWASSPKLKAMYGFAGEKGGCAIVDADSAAELNSEVLVNPAAGLYDFEVHALTTTQEMMATVAEMEKLMAQMAPPS